MLVGKYFETLLDGVDGWLKLSEAEWLANKAASSIGTIVEIGSFRGRSSIALAVGANVIEVGPVVCIDPHPTYVDHMGGEFDFSDQLKFLQNIMDAGCGDRIRIVNLASDHALQGWTEPIGLLWVDGGHSYDQALRDVIGWTKHVKVGGIIAVHDNWDDTIKQVLVEFEKSFDLEPIEARGSISAYVKKTEKVWHDL